MKVTVLFDEETLTPNLKTGFGLSLLINDSVIFDTGSDVHALLHNIRTLNINTSMIKIIVLSHEHEGHTNGLSTLFSILENPYIYICPSFPQKIKQQIEEYGGVISASYTPVRITEDIYITGEICGIYRNEPMPEQSFIKMNSNNYATLVCSCAHYGLIKGIDRIQKRIAYYYGRQVIIDTIIGGFHLRHESDTILKEFSKKLCELGIAKVAPLHCCGENGKRILKSHYGNDFYDLKVGSTIEI